MRHGVWEEALVDEGKLWMSFRWFVVGEPWCDMSRASRGWVASDSLLLRSAGWVLYTTWCCCV
jgi:hypothetical protein